MAVSIKAIKGTKDTLPSESYKIQYIEQAALDTAKAYGFHEIRTPVFEYTELFDRSVGETTDVVQKEMYTFNDKGDRSITLRPEGTAGAVRVFLEHGLFNEPLPQKVCYLTSCYRYEKPQAGRLREFHQFGIECFGASSALQDAEIIALANSYFNFIGIEKLAVEINSIGCPECRKKYSEALKAYFEESKSQLCETCLSRLDRNPMRILDCKSPVCSEIAKNAPKITDYLCDECDSHFKSVQNYLNVAGIEFTVNPTIVRGLDYYTKTVFEFVSDSIGSQGTVCGGGRYDGLTEELGGQRLPSLGFAMGMERLLMVMDSQGIEIPKPQPCDLYVAGLGEKAQEKAFELIQSIRQWGLQAETDVVGRGLRAQMKYADKIGAQYSMVIGDNEIEQGIANLKNMTTGEQTSVNINDDFAENFVKLQLAASFGNFEEC